MSKHTFNGTNQEAIMALLREEDQKLLTEEFNKMDNNLKMLFFSQELDCTYCTDTRQILTEVSDLSDKIQLTEYNPQIDRDVAAKYGVDKVPAIVITDMDETNVGVRFFGIPSGYEFVSLIGAIRDRGTGNLEISEETQEAIKAIDKPVHLQVFVTPTCPYCPSAVRVAHQLATLNPNITADCIEATEFPELSRKYRVMGVPRVVINDNHYFEGALPEPVYMQKIQEAVTG
jgi:glutaredoxin-like protein